MRTIEFQSQTNGVGNLEINYSIKENNKNVRVVVLNDEEIESKEKTVIGFDAKKYLGTIKFDSDPMDIQNEMRDEWQ